MGIMDKVKAQATQIADRAQQAGQVGQAKLAELQAKRKADGMLLELGGIYYSERTGKSVPDAETRSASLVAQLRAHEAEFGPVKLAADDSDGDSGGDSGEGAGSEAD